MARLSAEVVGMEKEGKGMWEEERGGEGVGVEPSVLIWNQSVWKLLMNNVLVTYLISINLPINML